MEWTDVLKFEGFWLDWVPDEAAVAVARNGKYIYFRPGVPGVSIRPGQPVEPGSLAWQVAETGERIERRGMRFLGETDCCGVGYPIPGGAIIVLLPSAYIVKKERPVTVLTGKSDDRWHPVPVNDILYIESQQKKTWFCTEEGRFSTSFTLKELRARLPESFLTCHRSYIVNTGRIKEITRDISSGLLLKMADGSLLPISQNFTADIRDRLGF
ncbi:LytTR family DNA-binding domain-containing protein [Indiicoccus explosivorum]|uniref:LytTR family DNA-binding domain-containing protein n=1 Tax=Indiicoccus explosivorum TaxID=1917864 RepID=UPI0013903772|nr:LytTR family DNA-binding domain-containing protein [Indiicoccus explosivorum]